MPSVKDENAMATNEAASGTQDSGPQDSGAREPDDDKPEASGSGPRAKPPAAGSGFFTIYKSGQGYWTRMGTAAAAALLALLTMGFIDRELPVYLAPLFTPVNPSSAAVMHATTMSREVTWSICAAFLIGFTLLTFILMNKPTNADFMIATDSEMKKVNWTSRKELVGSTKVVIAFMFMIAFLLFALDVVFGYLFYFLHVLKTPPF